MIRKIFARVGIRIEIIIHMNGIHIITGNNIAHNLANVFTVFGQSRIKIKLTEQTGIKYYLDENRDYCVPKRSAEEIARSL